MPPPVFIHPGFSNTGTTSLQLNFFSNRDDIFFAGEPYGPRGGLFTQIRSIEGYRFNAPEIQSLCRCQIYDLAQERPIVISDETLTEAPQLYFHPFVMPRDTIADRLKMLFPDAKIIFTIREQRTRVAAMYFNLKRNHAKFARMPIPPFPEWLDAMLAQVRSQYLHNLNYTETIDLYASLFSEHNVLILPIEMAVVDSRGFLSRLCAFMDLPLRDEDVRNFAFIQNRRMSERHARVSELLADYRFAPIWHELEDAFGRTVLEQFLDAGKPAARAAIDKQRAETIRQIVEGPNHHLAQRFNLDLKPYGYLLPQEARQE
jgi:hypothetical protein